MFPKVKDFHKLGRPEVPTGYGIFYVLGSIFYLFILHLFNIHNGSLTLAVCILFGGLLGLFDDFANLKWRYKALLPLLATLPLIALREGNTIMATYIWGQVDFGVLFYILVIPVIVMVTTNVINMTGGLCGLDTLCPLVILVGLAAISNGSLLLLVPIIVLGILGYLNWKGKIFLGNIGSFAIGVTLCSFAIIENIEQSLLICLIPYIFNSGLILLNIFLFKRRASLILGKDGKLIARHIRSLQTMIAKYYGRVTEHFIVIEIFLLVCCFTMMSIVIWLMYL